VDGVDVIQPNNCCKDKLRYAIMFVLKPIVCPQIFIVIPLKITLLPEKKDYFGVCNEDFFGFGGISFIIKVITYILICRENQILKLKY
jgi:hypothetical protein